MAMYERSALQRDLLFVVAGVGPASGQTIKSELKQSQDTDLLPGVLYSNLDELVEAGLVAKGERDGRTNEYAVTEDGRQALRDLLCWQRGYADALEAH
ncbi:PadR family transcriptional regulator [Halobacterium litoreum]|uniref:PadR family transcriptional regulator n=1 Tax=Halobacterium litoreum TaxID=2039234 RepID=A0ABD5NC68_9EURY|nr:PadR family transcriptional regulator [Halobacterium litoreum]UHH14393.1 PadR family transcriptional regulator [Halobacterium litoreum]